MKNIITDEIQELIDYMESEAEIDIMFGELENVFNNRKALFQHCNKEDVINGVLLEDEFNLKIAKLYLEPYIQVIDKVRNIINEVTGISIDNLKKLPVSLDTTNYLPPSVLGAYVTPYKNAEEMKKDKTTKGIPDTEKNIISLKFDPHCIAMTKYGIENRLYVLVHEYAHYIHMNLMKGIEIDLPQEGIGEYAKTSWQESWAEAFREYVYSNANTENAKIVRKWEGSDEEVNITERNKAVKAVLDKYKNVLGIK